MMPASAPELSVTIVNWNTADLLRACLASLQAESERVAMEVIVVDNGSSDPSPEMVRREFPEVVLLRNPQSRGFAAATNQALARAQAPYWAFLGPDTVVEPGALETLLTELKTQPEIAAVGPQLLNRDGSLQPSGRKFPTLRRVALEGLLPSRLKRTAWWIKKVFGRTDFQIPAWVDEVSGACLIARREVFEAIGLLDERFFIYYEEVDWFRRLAAAAQGKVLYQPAARVFHCWGAGMQKMKGEGVLIHYRSALKFWRKHRGFFGACLYRLITLFQVAAWMSGSALRRSQPFTDMKTLRRLLRLMLFTTGAES